MSYEYLHLPMGCPPSRSQTQGESDSGKWLSGEVAQVGKALRCMLYMQYMYFFF